jgi:hypothetical protein
MIGIKNGFGPVFYAYFSGMRTKNFYFKIEGLVVLKAGNQLGIFSIIMALPEASK